MSLLRGGLVLGLAQGVTVALRLARNVLLARLLGAEEFGIAATFVIVLALVEAMSQLGLDRLVVQDRDGDSPRFLATVQSLVVLRGLGLALLVVAVAEPAAALLGQPGLAPAYRLLALVPLVAAVVPVDAMRQQRALRFGMRARMDVAGMAASLAVAAPLVLWLGDHRAILGIVLVETAVATALGHRLAERPFRLGWDGAVVRRALGFGWPLLASGPLGFLAGEANRVIVAGQYGAAALGLFAATLTLTATPLIFLGRVLFPLLLAALSRARDDDADPARAARMNLATLQLYLALAALTATGVVLAAPGLCLVVFGPGYAGAMALAAPVGIAAAVPLLRGGIGLVAFVHGRTVDTLVADLVRLLGLPAAWALAASGQPVAAMVLAFVAGELAALAVAALLLARQPYGPALLAGLAGPGALAALHLGLAGWIAWGGAGWVAAPAAALPPLGPALGLLALLGAVLWACAPLRRAAAAAAARARR